MKVIRNGISAALLLLALGVLQACDTDPMGPRASEDDKDDTQCAWIDGMLHCR